MLELAKNQNIQQKVNYYFNKKLYDEIKEKFGENEIKVEDYDKLIYSQCVIKESLR